MTPSARLQAAIELLDAIIAAARDGGPAADTLIAAYFKTRRYAGSKDRRAVRDLVYEAVRRSGERPESGRAAVVGLAQDRPDLAALFDGSAHGPAPLTPGEPASVASTVPSWIAPLLAGMVEQNALLDRAPLDLRINRLKVDEDTNPTQPPFALFGRGGDEPAGDEFADLVLPYFPDALRLPEGTAVEQTEAWTRGLIEIQDAGSQHIAAICEARPGHTVVDLCAGAGGKTLALAAAMAGQGRLIAADANRARLQRLPPRAPRAGAAVIETLLLAQGHEDRALGPLAGIADIVLVDAPCSGTGTWRRNPEARWRLTPARLDRLVAEQARLLDLAAPLLAPGGRLVYAVCALTDREGRLQIDAFLDRHPGWTVDVPMTPPGRRWGAGVLLTPAHDGTDGFFLARLQKP